MLLAFNGRAQSDSNGEMELDALFTPVNEIYFSFDAPADRATLDAISRIISIDNVREGRVWAYANRSEFGKFLKYGYTWKLLPHPGSLNSNPRMLDRVDTKGITEWDFYPTYDGYLQMMNDYAANYPDLCTLIEFGTSIQNRKLLAVRITSNVNTHKPEFFYTSTMHGDETTGYVLMLRLIDYLLSNYGTNPRITQLIDNIDLYVNPLANPDGTYKGGNNSVSGAIRYNANFIDINRNFPDPEDGPHPDGNAWQKETIAFMDFAEAHHFVMSANFHGGSEVMNYPWDTWSRLHTDTPWLLLVCNEYADTAQAYSPSGYMNDFGTGVTNGYAWYTITGGRQDYMTFFHQCREVTMEISETKNPPASQLPNFWNYNYRSLLNYLEQVTYGITGTITDSITGEPVRAQVFILNHDLAIDSSMVFSRETDGAYFRLLKSGNWTMEVSAPGYVTKTITDVNVTDYNRTVRNVELCPLGVWAGFSASSTQLIAGQSISFTDQSVGDPTAWQWSFPGATPAQSLAQNPVAITYAEEGVYDVTLTASNSNYSNTKEQWNYILVGNQYLMPSGRINTCQGMFYDDGGPNHPYTRNTEKVVTFTSTDPDKQMRIIFQEFALNTDCLAERLEIYNGDNLAAPLIGSWCGTDNPGSILSSNTARSLTVKFVAADADPQSGWKASLQCDTGVGIVASRQSDISIWPIPAKEVVYLSNVPEHAQIEIFSTNGQHVWKGEASASINTRNLKPGIYWMKITGETLNITKKIIIH